MIAQKVGPWWPAPIFGLSLLRGDGGLFSRTFADLFFSPFATWDFLTFLHRTPLPELKRFKVDDFRHFLPLIHHFLARLIIK